MTYAAIVLMGEPKRWESALQIILDVLRTDGQPDRASDAPNSQLPVVACNMDLQFKDRAAMPRYARTLNRDRRQIKYNTVTLLYTHAGALQLLSLVSIYFLSSVR